MPVYEYTCSDCQLKFELLRPVSKVNEGVHCPRCHKSAERVFSTFASFSKSDSGLSTPVAGTGSSCSSCNTTGCSSCGL
jgi:putative FmdB family regulatory protein